MALKDIHVGHVPDAPVPAGDEIAALGIGDVIVARYCDGAALPVALAPRPFLHPVTTLSGTVVSDAQPEDHRWHLGVSITLQDVGGANIWGGRTYVRDAGYTWLPDHGSQVHTGWLDRSRERFRETLRWRGSGGQDLLAEERDVRVAPGAVGSTWTMDLSSTLTNVTPTAVTLGSPATNGRPGAGYGGLFWRLPPVAGQARVWTASAEGEDAVHGSLAPWVAYAVSGPRPFTLVLAGLDEVTRSDPWFVRVSDYPGLGSQLASEHPVVLEPGRATTRAFRAVVADGVLDADSVPELLAGAATEPEER